MLFLLEILMRFEMPDFELKQCGEHWTFTVHFDETAPGFEDVLQDSSFNRRLIEEKCFAELSPPVIDDHQDPRVAMTRLHVIDTQRVVGKITLYRFNTDSFTCLFTPCGPKAGTFLPSVNYRIAPRLIQDDDGNVLDIITFDLAQ